MRHLHSAMAIRDEERDVIVTALNELQIATRTGNTELVIDESLIGDVLMIAHFTMCRPAFREWCSVKLDEPTDGYGLVVPRDFVGDVLAMPMFQKTRKQFRDYCDSNLAALPGIDDLTRDRLRRMIRDTRNV